MLFSGPGGDGPAYYDLTSSPTRPTSAGTALQGKGKGPAAVDSRRPVSAAAFGRTQTPPKKLVIQAFKVKPKLPDNYEALTWEKLRKAVLAIHESRPVSDSKEELYKACENLCHHKKADSLYVKLGDVNERHIKRELDRLKQATSTDPSILKALNDCWLNHCRQTIMIRNIFLFLDRTYVLQTVGLKSLWDMGLDLFRKNIMDDAEVRKRTVEGILLEIEKERNGDQISRELLRTLLRMFIDLSIYYTGFDIPFRERTEAFYRTESDRMIAELDGPSDIHGGNAVARYLLHVEERLRQESERCTSTLGYLDASSKRALVTILELEMVKKHAIILLDR
ncbi:Cullin repeat-like-containing domain protein, partial [Blyttiomyces helicus]